MKINKPFALTVAGLIGALFLVLFRLPGSSATAQEGRQPFASSVEQRQQTVEELRKLNALMQKQIDLLTSGKVRVIVVEREPEAGKRNER